MTVLLPNAVFLHIPKTGGMWIRQALHEADLAIEDLAKTQNKRHPVPEIDPNIKIPMFAFVRHPITWYQSYWAMRARDNSWDKGVKLDTLCQADNFQQFIDNIISNFPNGELHNIYSVWTRHCAIVGKQEYLPYSLFVILDYLRLPYDPGNLISIPPINVGNNDFKELAEYRPGQKSKILEIEKRTLDMYNYSGQATIKTFAEDLLR